MREGAVLAFAAEAGAILISPMVDVLFDQAVGDRMRTIVKVSPHAGR